jgi:hypothetical protein
MFETASLMRNNIIDSLTSIFHQIYLSNRHPEELLHLIEMNFPNLIEFVCKSSKEEYSPTFVRSFSS